MGDLLINETTRNRHLSVEEKGTIQKHLVQSKKDHEAHYQKVRNILINKEARMNSIIEALSLTSNRIFSGYLGHPGGNFNSTLLKFLLRKLADLNLKINELNQKQDEGDALINGINAANLAPQEQERIGARLRQEVQQIVTDKEDHEKQRIILTNRIQDVENLLSDQKRSDHQFAFRKELIHALGNKLKELNSALKELKELQDIGNILVDEVNMSKPLDIAEKNLIEIRLKQAQDDHTKNNWEKQRTLIKKIEAIQNLITKTFEIFSE